MTLNTTFGLNTLHMTLCLSQVGTGEKLGGCFCQLLNSLMTQKLFPEAEGKARSWWVWSAGEQSGWWPTAAWAQASQSLVTTAVWAARVWQQAEILGLGIGLKGSTAAMNEEWVQGGEKEERVSGSLEDEAMPFGGSSWCRWSRMNEADLHHIIIIIQ